MLTPPVARPRSYLKGKTRCSPFIFCWMSTMSRILEHIELNGMMVRNIKDGSSRCSLLFLFAFLTYIRHIHSTEEFQISWKMYLIMFIFLFLLRIHRKLWAKNLHDKRQLAKIRKKEKSPKKNSYTFCITKKKWKKWKKRKKKQQLFGW